MDLEKAKHAHFLYARRDELKSTILTMQSRIEKNKFGTTNLTIPTMWLPSIISIAEHELRNIEEEIEKL